MTIYDSGKPMIVGTRSGARFDLVDLPAGQVQLRGTWDECAWAVKIAIRSGRLLQADPIRPDGTDRYLLTMRLAPQPRLVTVTRREPWYREQPGLAVAFLVTVLGMVGLGAWALSVVVPVLPEVAGVAAATALLVALGWTALGQVGACPGIHCPGCKCGKG